MRRRAALVGSILVGACGSNEDRFKLVEYCEGNPTARICTQARGNGDQSLPELYKLISGAWKTPCVTGREYDGRFVLDVLRFEKSDEFQRSYTTYADKDCALPLFEIANRGNVSVQKKESAVAFRTILTLNESSLTPKSEAGANALNASAACKRTDWTANRQENLANCAYRFHSGAPDEQWYAFSGLEWFEFVTIKNGTLYLSKKVKGELYFPKADLAPSAADESYAYKAN